MEYNKRGNKQTKKQTNVTQIFFYENTEISDPDEIANKPLNKYFANVGPNLAEKMQPSLFYDI